MRVGGRAERQIAILFTDVIARREAEERLRASEAVTRENVDVAVVEAADSVAGLKVLRSDARIDLLLTDVGLPGGVNGRQMADAARVVRLDLKTLFITGYAKNAVIVDGQLDPGMQVLTKPFAVDSLAAGARELMTV